MRGLRGSYLHSTVGGFPASWQTQVGALPALHFGAVTLVVLPPHVHVIVSANAGTATTPKMALTTRIRTAPIAHSLAAQYSMPIRAIRLMLNLADALQFVCRPPQLAASFFFLTGIHKSVAGYVTELKFG
jgi:hypothetical protein